MYPHTNPAQSAKRPILCYVTDRHALAVPVDSDPLAALNDKIAEVAGAGIHWIQVREKDLSAKQLAALIRNAQRATSSAASRQKHMTPGGPRIIINDRLDVAIAERADGVHLGETSILPTDARRLIQAAQQKGLIAEDFFLGVSCHSLEAAKSAEAVGANYVIFGPVFATPSKAQYGATQGLGRLAEVCGAISISVLAIGGITLKSARSCLEAGASGIAAIRLFQNSADPALMTQQLHKQLRGLSEPWHNHGVDENGS